MASLAHLANLCQTVTDRKCKVYSASGVDFAIIGRVLVLGGSNQVSDWFYNLQAWNAKSPIGNGFVHSGHLRLAKKAWPKIKSECNKRGIRISHLVGYSLGGAIALLIGEKLKDVQVTTFGAPAVGSREWAERYPNQVTRCTVETDFVTKEMFGRVQFGAHVAKRGGSNPVCNHVNTLAIWGSRGGREN